MVEPIQDLPNPVRCALALKVGDLPKHDCGNTPRLVGEESALPQSQQSVKEDVSVKIQHPT